MLNTLAGIIASSGGAAASTTSYESIATVTVGSGGTSSVDFTSIVGTYTHLQIRGIMNSTAADGLYLAFNGDTGSNYVYHRLTGNGTNTGTGSGTSMASGTKINVGIGFPSTANIFGPLIVDILDYSNANKYKTTRTLTGGDTNGGGGVEYDSGLWMNTNAITSIKLSPTAGTIAQYSSFALYGIKG